ncbi:hypothetical protein LSAT2_028653, partial [Lamellibrachia satsuma]
MSYCSNLSSNKPYCSNLSSDMSYCSNLSSNMSYSSNLSSNMSYCSNLSSDMSYCSNLSSNKPYCSNLSSDMSYCSNLSSDMSYFGRRQARLSERLELRLHTDRLVGGGPRSQVAAHALAALTQGALRVAMAVHAARVSEQHGWNTRHEFSPLQLDVSLAK